MAIVDEFYELNYLSFNKLNLRKLVWRDNTGRNSRPLGVTCEEK